MAIPHMIKPLGRDCIVESLFGMLVTLPGYSIEFCVMETLIVLMLPSLSSGLFQITADLKSVSCSK